MEYMESQMQNEIERGIRDEEDAQRDASAKLAELIQARLLGVHPDEQDLVLEDHDWRRIIEALDPRPAASDGEAVADSICTTCLGFGYLRKAPSICGAGGDLVPCPACRQSPVVTPIAPALSDQEKLPDDASSFHKWFIPFCGGDDPAQTFGRDEMLLAFYAGKRSS